MDLPSQIQVRLDALGLRAQDIEESFVRGSGPGGQKINKTASTVCLRHRPTGIEVRCQRERSQAANRELAWAELVSKLEQRLRAAELARQSAFEQARRRNRPKSHRQKVRQIEAKRHRAGIKSFRGRPGQD